MILSHHSPSFVYGDKQFILVHELFFSQGHYQFIAWMLWVNWKIQVSLCGWRVWWPPLSLNWFTANHVIHSPPWQGDLYLNVMMMNMMYFEALPNHTNGANVTWGCRDMEALSIFLGSLWGKSRVHRWILITRGHECGYWMFSYCTRGQAFEKPLILIWDPMALTWHHCNETATCPKPLFCRLKPKYKSILSPVFLPPMIYNTYSLIQSKFLTKSHEFS